MKSDAMTHSSDIVDDAVDTFSEKAERKLHSHRSSVTEQCPVVCMYSVCTPSYQGPKLSKEPDR